MNDELNIRVTTSGVTTIGQLADEIKKAKLELKGMALASQEAANQKSKIEALTNAYRKHTHISSEFSKLIREERIEQRQTNFALREGIGALAAMGLQGKVLNETLGGMVTAFSGVSFALKALAPNLAGIATPVGLAAAAFFLFNQILQASKKLTEDINTGLTEQARLLKEAGLATNALLRSRLQLNLQEANKKFSDAGGGLNWESFIPFAGEGIAEKAKHKERIDAYNEVLKIVGQIKKLDDEDASERQKSLDLAFDTEKKIHALKKEVETDRKEATKKAIEQENKSYEGRSGLTGNPLRTNLSNIAPISRPGSALISQPLNFGGGKETSNISVALAQFSAELKDSSETINNFKSGLWNVTDSLTESFVGLIRGTESLGGVFVSFGQSIIDVIVQMAAQAAANAVVGGILGVFGLAKGGDVVPGGGSLSFAASGGNYRFGGMQNVIVGERGAELMQVGSNGVRIIPNNKLSQINQMGQSGRFSGGNDNMIMGSRQIETRIEGNDLVIVHQLALQSRKGRVG